MKVLCGLFVLSLLSFSLAQQCPNPYLACGPACYSSDQYTCINGQLCPAGDSLCGSQCYSPSQYTCYGTQLCPAGDSLCSNACYNPSQYSCSESGMLCPAGLAFCGNACYNRTAYHCDGNGNLQQGPYTLPPSATIVSAFQNNNFSVAVGKWGLFNITECAQFGNCYYNNPVEPYSDFLFDDHIPVIPGNNGHAYWNLDPNEAIVFVGFTPPQCRYYAFTPYLFARGYANIQTNPVFASLTDSLNDATIRTVSGQCNDAPPFQCAVALIVGFDSAVVSRIEAVLSSVSIQSGSFNEFPLAGTLLNTGHGPTKDIFFFWGRTAAFVDESAGLAYLNSQPGYVYQIHDLTVTTQPSPTLYGYPSFRNPVPYPVENATAQVQTLARNVAGYYAAHGGIVTPALSVDYLAFINYTNGWTCINQSKECEGENRDSRYVVNAPPFSLPNTSTYIIAVGAIHTDFGIAVYTSVTTNDVTTSVGINSILDTHLQGTAAPYTGGSTDPVYQKLYVVKFARCCPAGDPACYVVPTGLNGAALQDPIRLIERVTLNPYSLVLPAYLTVTQPVYLQVVVPTSIC